MTVNVFEVIIQALGPDSQSPAASEALYAAVDAAQAALKEHGFAVAHTGYGVRPLEAP